MRAARVELASTVGGYERGSLEGWRSVGGCVRRFALRVSASVRVGAGVGERVGRTQSIRAGAACEGWRARVGGGRVKYEG